MQEMSAEEAGRVRRLARRVEQAGKALACAESLARGLGPRRMAGMFFAQVLRAARQSIEAPADVRELFEEARRVAGVSGAEGHCEGG
jgi:hypothetical protein